MICDCSLSIDYCDHTNLWSKSIWTIEISNFSKISDDLPPFVYMNPPLSLIPFVSEVKKVNEVHGPNADKTEMIKFEFFMDSENGVFKHSCH
jgi:hypothetical protein